MKSTKMMYALQFLLLLIGLVQAISPNNKIFCFLTNKYEVYVVNNLPTNTPPLRLRCQSKNNDLGYHNLTTNGNFNFHFCEKLDITLFFCHLWWKNKEISFDVFDSKWRGHPCDKNGVCYWAAKEDGIYFSVANPPDRLDKVYGW